jgi:sugar phosphate isomerase/epimerase
MITRRRFTSLATAAAFAPPPIHLNIGVGAFSYHSLSIPAMVERLVQLNVREIEMSRGEFMLMKPPTPAMCEAARGEFDRAGIRCVSYYTATIKNAQDLNYAIRYAKILGASNVSGDATGPILHDIDEQFTRAGLTFGIHNHFFPNQKFAYESVDDVLAALRSLSKTVGATLDIGQMAACGHDTVDAVHRLAPRLKVVHLKDVASSGAEHNVLLGQGIAKIPAVVAALREVHFSGLVAIEYEKEDDVDQDMRQQLQYARQLA